MTDSPLKNMAALQAADMIQTLQEQHNADFDATLSKLVESAGEVVPPAQYVGVTVATQDGKVQTAAASHGCPGMLDDIQQRHGQGPCLSAAWENHVIRVDDMTGDRRWPAYCADAVEQTPIRSALCFRVFANHHAQGTLNFYAEQPHAFDDDAAELGFVVATHTALAWTMVRRDEQFRSALASRDTIGQAKGILMERFDIDTVQAFELLRRLSQESNMKLTEIAYQLVEREHPQ